MRASPAHAPGLGIAADLAIGRTTDAIAAGGSPPSFRADDATARLGNLTVGVVDPDPLSLERSCQLIGRNHRVRLVGRAQSLPVALAIFERRQPDLLLVEARLGAGPLEVSRAFAGRGRLMLAFTSVTPVHACAAFEAGALDYLMKPLDVDRLDSLLCRATERVRLLEADDRAAELERVVEQLRDQQCSQGPRTYENEIWVRQRGRDHVRVPVETIDRITVQDDYVSISARGREHLLRLSLEKMLSSLDPKIFVRVHRSMIVRRDRVEKLSMSRTGSLEVVMTDGSRLPVGRIHARCLPWHRDRTARPSS